MTSANPARPTSVRFLVLFATALVATSMYVDRACLSQVIDLIRDRFGMEEWQKDWVLASFFFTYALAQVPGGWLGTRIGQTRALTLYLVLWSICTAGAGLATGFVGLLVIRLATGLAQAGTYPASASVVRGWFPMAVRGRASSVVALGGRLGWVLSQVLTPVLVAPAALLFVGWQWTLILYGLVGLVGAVLYALVARDSAREHPWSNHAEADLVDPPGPRSLAIPRIPWGLLASSGNMWLSGALQFCVNLGWVFLITGLPTFLTEARGVPIEERGWMAAVPAWASCVGMFLGGFFTDALTHRFGLRWGRSIPMGGMMFVCAAAYLLVSQLQHPWLIVATLAVMGMGVDLSNPALWAFSQDVGGSRHVGAALGWGNMWGNFGAFVSPILLGAVQRGLGWDAAFLTCAGAFILAGVCGLAMNAARPLEPEAAEWGREVPPRPAPRGTGSTEIKGSSADIQP